MIGVVVISAPAVPTVALIILHLVAGGLALLCLEHRVSLAVLLPVIFAVYIVDYYATPDMDGPLFLATAWFGNVLFLVTPLLLLGRLSQFMAPIAAMVGLAVLLAVKPGWTVQTSLSILVTATLMTVALGFGLPVLRRLAADADRTSAQAATQRQAAHVAASAARGAADDARTLHDTVINTLGAIASGGAAIRDVEAVRHRCGLDASTVRVLLGGTEAVTPRGLAAVIELPMGVDIERVGLTTDDLEQIESTLQPEVVQALGGAVREAVQNVAKHSGAARCRIGARRDGPELVLWISDDGVGFPTPAPPGRGLTHSVIARMESVGGTARITSEPGAGTTVELRCPLEPEVSPTSESATPGDSAPLLRRIQRRSCLVWAAGTVAVGVVIEVVNRPGHLTPVYAVLLLVSVLAAGSWLATRHGAAFPRWLQVMVAVAVPVSFVVNMANIGFGLVDVYIYQAFAFTPLLVILLTFPQRRTALTTALVLLGITVVTMTVVLGLESSDRAAIVLVAAAPTFGLVAAWAGFYRLTDQILTQSEIDRHVTWLAQRETAARRALTAARERWRATGLHLALTLLEGLANGSLAADDPQVRHRCDTTESHLRQVIQLSPELIRMGVWFARALTEARQREVSLTVRTGEVDAPDDHIAQLWGQLLIEVVHRAASGDHLVFSLFGGAETVRLMIVGSKALADVETPAVNLDGWQSSHVSTPDQELIEIVVPRAQELPVT